MTGDATSALVRATHQRKRTLQAPDRGTPCLSRRSVTASQRLPRAGPPRSSTRSWLWESWASSFLHGEDGAGPQRGDSTLGRSTVSLRDETHIPWEIALPAERTVWQARMHLH